MEVSSGGGVGGGGGGQSVGSIRIAIQDLFNVYLGRSLNSKLDGNVQETLTSSLRKRVSAASRPQPPKEEQFPTDFLQLFSQFTDQEQGRAVTEAVLAPLLIQCSSHGPQTDFLFTALQMLAKMGVVRWDSFLPMLLQTTGTTETNDLPLSGISQGGMGSLVGQAGGPVALMMGGAAAATSSGSPSPSSNLLTSPARSSAIVSAAHPNSEQLSVNASQLSASSNTVIPGARVMNWLRPLVCKIVLAALQGDLKPVTCLEVLLQVVQWINTCGTKGETAKEEEGPTGRRKQNLEYRMWLPSCVDVIWALIDESKCRIPFYALLHDRTQLQVEQWPEDEGLFALYLEVHRRRDKIALHMLPLDQHLHCPTFATLRIPSLTYPGTMGEPLHGEEVANAVPRGSVEWDKAMRCLRQALRSCVSNDWWKKVLVLAPRLKKIGQQPATPRTAAIYLGQPALEFSAEMTSDAAVERVMELMQPLPTGNTAASVSESARWQEWLMFADLFYYLMSTGYLDFLDFIDKLAARFATGTVMPSNHVTWLLAQVFRLETVSTALSSDSQVETARKLLSFNMAERSVDQSGMTAQALLLDYVGSSQTLRLWSINRTMMDHLHGNRMQEHMQKGKLIDEWWKQVYKGDRVLDYSMLDEKSMGMVWVLSNTMTQPISEALMTWFKSSGVVDFTLPSNNVGQPGERLSLIHETRPLPITLLSGLSLHLCIRIITQIEELIFSGQVVPSIAMVETYVRLLLVAPQSLFRQHYNGMMHRFQSGMAKPGVSLLLLELLNFRLVPLYRFHNKQKNLIIDITKILITAKVKRGEHRLFRLAENLGMNLILNLREVMLIKKELKGATTEFTETLNRIMVVNLAFTMKTRGIADFEQMVFLKPALEQILTSSQHTWSEKTMRHFPALLREALAGRPDKRSQILQSWQQSEAMVMNQCRQMLVASTDPNYVVSYITHSIPQHRQFLCAGAWMLMDGHTETISIASLGRALKELSPEEVTTNVYMMVDVLLHSIHLQLQHGHSLQDLLLRASAGLAHFMWSQELLPFDVVLLALTDRDDDTHALRLVVGLLLDRPEFQQRVQTYYVNRGQTEHWLQTGPFQRHEPPQVLGSHLAGKDRYPVFFDDMCLRALPVIPLIIYRLIENDATETAERLLMVYAPLIFYHPTRFSFVRDTLAYFYGHLPTKLVRRLLSSMDLAKIPFSEAFLPHIKSVNSVNTPSYDYFANLLVGLVNNVIPPLNGKTKTSPMGVDGLPTLSRPGPNRGQAASSPTTSNTSEVNKAFYLHQDPGTYSQLLLETAVVELLSLTPPPTQIVAMLIQIAVRLPVSHAQPGTPRSPLSPSSLGDPLSGSNAAGLTSPTTQYASPLMIQACGLLLAQLPTAFHVAIYTETARIIKKDCWWLTDPSKQSRDLDSIFGYSTWDPSWAVQDETATVIGNTVALLHAIGANLPFEWLEGMHAVITIQRPITSLVHLRLCYRIMGPLLPRLLISRPLFAKTLALLLTILADVFGRSPQASSVTEASEISDLVDFLHHAVMMEVQMTGQAGGRPRPDTLVLCTKAVERLRPDLQHLFRHLSADPNSSIYAATHPKILQRTAPPLMGVM